MLIHENVDISCDSISFFCDLVEIELSEDDSVHIVKLYQEMVGFCGREDSYCFFEKVANKFLELLVQNLNRLDENKQDQFNAVHKSLKILEAMIEIIPDLPQILCDNTKIFHWLIKKLNPKNKLSDRVVDDNKLYASETLILLLQNHKENQFTFAKMGGIDYLLNMMAVRELLF